MSDTKYDRFVRTIPKAYKPEVNPFIRALLKAWGQEHDTLVDQIQNTKEQIFVYTAEGQYLDRLGASLGVRRPPTMGLQDDDYRKLIPVLSMEAKSVRKVFYDAMDVFWGPLFTRTNVTSVNFAPFNVSTGDVLNIAIDGGDSQEIKVLAGDISSPGAATASEMIAILGRINGASPSIITDQATGHQFINVRTNTPGARGSVEILSSTMVSGSKLDLPVKKLRITDLSQRCVVWEIRPKELVVELPAILPTLRRTLEGSHHFHSTSALEPVINGDSWKGSFLFNPTGAAYTITRARAQIQEVLQAGNVYTKVTIDDGSLIPNEPGNLIFDFGKTTVEQPVKYIGKPNNNTLLLDPSHIFTQTHGVNAYVNVLAKTLQPATPDLNGDDLAIYFTSPSNSRAIVQQLLQDLAAAGVVVTFAILLPAYEYLVKNPYA